MNAPPTLTQVQLLHHIERGWVECRPCSIRRLCELMGYKSTNSVSEMLLALEKKGLAVREDRRAHGVRLTRLGLRYLRDYQGAISGAEVAQ